VPSFAPAGDLHFDALRAQDGAGALALVADRARDLTPAAAGGAGLLRLQVQRARGAVVGLLQRDLGPAYSNVLAARWSAAAHAAEEAPEDISSRRLRLPGPAPQQVVMSKVKVWEPPPRPPWAGGAFSKASRLLPVLAVAVVT